MQPHIPQQTPYISLTRFYETFCVEVIARMMQTKPAGKAYTIFQTAQQLTILFQHNELAITPDKNSIRVVWWEGYHRYNGEPHPEYPIAQLQRSFYKLHNPSAKIFRTGDDESPFNGHKLLELKQVAEIIVTSYLKQRPAPHISYWRKSG
jgi:hypothetical protein